MLDVVGAIMRAHEFPDLGMDSSKYFSKQGSTSLVRLGNERSVLIHLNELSLRLTSSGDGNRRSWPSAISNTACNAVRLVRKSETVVVPPVIFGAPQLPESPGHGELVAP